MPCKWTRNNMLGLSFTCCLPSFQRTYSWVKSIRFCRSMSSRYARMLLLMNRLSWSLIQSLKTNAKIPVVNSRKKMIPRNTENYSRREHDEFTHWAHAQSIFSVKKRFLITEHTNLRRNVFSRSAPMHPAKPRMNMTPPTTMKSQTGSRPPRSVMDERLDRTPWRVETEHSNTLSLSQLCLLQTQHICQKGHSDRK